MIARNNSIDAIRGIAIIIMITANAWPYIYPIGYCPSTMRLLFSTAAPIFIFLTGVSIRISHEAGKQTWVMLKRGIQILMMAVGIDIFIWNILPFYTMDVLFLISISTFMLVAYKFISIRLQILVSIALILSIFIIRSKYQFELTEIAISQHPLNYPIKVALRHIFIDGWFPILPWMGIASFGYILYSLRATFKKNDLLFLISGVIITATFFLIIIFSSIYFNPLRKGYTEVFYPVSGFFLVYLLGIFCIILYFFNHRISKMKFISNLGEVSLPIYLLHTIIIKLYLPLFTQSVSNFKWVIFLFSLISFYFFIFFMTYILRKYLIYLKGGKYKILGYIIGV